MLTTRVFILIFTLILSWQGLLALSAGDTIVKEKETKTKDVLIPYHRNVIKFNPTPMLLPGQISNITLTYERLIKKNQSVSLQMGYLVFPKLIRDTVVNLIALNSGNKQGINLALDYRYYPSARNRRPAPDGIYIGGYVQYYGFKWKNTFDVLNTTVDQQGNISGSLNMVNVGLELGYQFVFWKRFTLDMLMFGPSFGYYNYNIAVTGGLDPELIEDLDQELVQRLMDRFPSLGEIFSQDGLTISGQDGGFSIGFRYALMLGFHF